MKALLFIPMYNCKNQIIRVLNKVLEVEGFFDTVLIVNNRSTDGGEDVVKQFIDSHKTTTKYVLVRNDENYCLGGSHKVAFNYAVDNHFDYVAVLHGDDQGDINDLIPYIKNDEIEKHDSMLGSRFEKKSILVNYSKFRIFGNIVFNKVLSVAVGRRLTDLGSGLNIYKTDFLKNKFYLGFPDSLTFNVYMLLYSVWSKSDFCFFPLTWREEDQVSNAKFVKQSCEILSLVKKYVFKASKLFARSEYNKNYTFEIIAQSKGEN